MTRIVHSKAAAKAGPFSAKQLAGAAILALSAACAPAAIADVINFNNVDNQFVGHGDAFELGNFVLTGASNAAGAAYGDLVGAVLDGTDPAACGMACPTNNTSNYYAALNDGIVYLDPLRAGGSVSLQGFDASFIGYAQGASYPAVAGLLRVQGFYADGSSLYETYQLGGPLGGDFSFRMFGNLDKTQADAWDINQGHQSDRTGAYANTLPAGREGVENKDINGVVRWDFAPLQSLELEAGYSRQGNLYAGDTQNTNSDAYTRSKYGDETNRLYRQNYSLTWNGGWDNGVTTSNWVQYEHTRNSRIPEGLAGGTEGKFNEKATQDFVDIDLDDVMLHSEVNLPIDFLVNQTLTLGTEWNQQRMKDLSSNTQALTGANTGGAIDGVSATDRSPYSKAEIFSLFAENNMELTDSTIVTPGLRFDHHSIVGNNWSPALNISQGLGDDFTLKMGIARAYKAPSLYQTNPNYILYSKGQGCYASAGGCYLQGNDDLKAETSINKEIGLEFKRDGWLAGVTWFRNDYRNKIEAGYVAVGQNAVGTDLYQWDNVPKAVVEGLEGSLNVPVSETVMWTNNITYMLKSENKTTGDRLSIIPEYTLNSTLSWQAREDLSMQTTFTWYGKQQPKKYNYKGQPAVGPETKEISPYSIVGLSATWDVTKNVSLTGGVDNLFDKRLWRAGNAQTTGDLAGANYIAGAGAYTYNEPGRTWYMSVNTHF